MTLWFFALLLAGSTLAQSTPPPALFFLEKILITNKHEVFFDPPEIYMQCETSSGTFRVDLDDVNDENEWYDFGNPGKYVFPWSAPADGWSVNCAVWEEDMFISDELLTSVDIDMHSFRINPVQNYAQGDSQFTLFCANCDRLGCDGVINSGMVYDSCGVCGGSNSSCSGCDGVPYSHTTFDSCGVCNGSNACVGCDGVPWSGMEVDECGVCGGGNECVGCDLVPWSGLECGVCGGDNSTCRDCAGQLVVGNSSVRLEFDKCHVCGGFGDTCTTVEIQVDASTPINLTEWMASLESILLWPSSALELVSAHPPWLVLLEEAGGSTNGTTTTVPSPPHPTLLPFGGNSNSTTITTLPYGGNGTLKLVFLLFADAYNMQQYDQAHNSSSSSWTPAAYPQPWIGRAITLLNLLGTNQGDSLQIKTIQVEGQVCPTSTMVWCNHRCTPAPCVPSPCNGIGSRWCEASQSCIPVVPGAKCASDACNGIGVRWCAASQSCIPVVPGAKCASDNNNNNIDNELGQSSLPLFAIGVIVGVGMAVVVLAVTAIKGYKHRHAILAYAQLGRRATSTDEMELQESGQIAQPTGNSMSGTPADLLRQSRAAP